MRKDLSPPQIAVQSAHAAIEIARSHIHPEAEHPSVIICGVDNKFKLEKYLDHFRSLDIICKPFYESDLDGQLTAFASEPVGEHQRHLFKRLQLLKPSDYFIEGGCV